MKANVLSIADQEALGLEPDDELVEYNLPRGYYTREGDVVTFHAECPVNNPPLVMEAE